MPKTLELKGTRFGRLLVLEKRPGWRNRAAWLCQCDCGCQTVVIGSLLKNGHTKSCGCLKRSVLGNSRRTHGMTDSITYVSWCEMKTRCTNESRESFENYGSIRVHSPWLFSFEEFLKDVGVRPSKEFTLDRIDPFGDYVPGNVRWATPEQQANNKKNSVFVTIDGVRKTVSEWAAEKGMSRYTIYARISKGWDPERAVLEKPKRAG